MFFNTFILYTEPSPTHLMNLQASALQAHTSTRIRPINYLDEDKSIFENAFTQEINATELLTF